MKNAQEQATTDDQSKQDIWSSLDAQDGAAPAEPSASESPQQTPQPQASQVQPSDPAPQAGSQDAPNPEQALMDKVAGLESLAGKLQERLRSAESHIGGLTSQLKRQLEAAKVVSATGGEAPSASEIRAAQASPVAMEALKRDYPEFADAMSGALREEADRLRKELSDQISASRPQQDHGAFARPEDLQAMRSELQVEMAHRGWQGRVRRPEFVGWLQRQPREVQMLAQSPDPQDAIRLLDLHVDATKSGSTQREQRQNAAAALPAGRGSAPVRSKPIEEMSRDEYWRYLDELERQKGT